MDGRSLDASKDSSYASAFRNNPDMFFIIKLSIFSFAHLLSFGYHFLSVFLHSVRLLAGLFCYSTLILIESIHTVFVFDSIPFLQFNCTYRRNQQPSDALPSIVPVPGRDPVKNASFTMELYDTLPFNNPSRQAFYTVSQNQQVFAEVCCYISDSTVYLNLTTFICPD